MKGECVERCTKIYKEADAEELDEYDTQPKCGFLAPIFAIVKRTGILYSNRF